MIVALLLSLLCTFSAIPLTLTLSGYCQIKHCAVMDIESLEEIDDEICIEVGPSVI